MTADTPETTALKDQARELLAQNRHGEAKALAERACAANAGDARAWHLLGLSSARLGEMDGARAAWQQALAIDPNDAESHSYLANVLVRLGLREQAVVHFREALRLRPDDINTLNNLGTVLSELNRLDEAARCYADALSLAPNAVTHFNLATVYMRTQRLAEAADHYRRALALAPERVEIYNNLGNALKYMGQLDQAEAAYGEAIRRIPDHPMAYANLGTLMLELGRLDEAQAGYVRALALNPDHRKAAIGLASICEKRGRFDEAYGRLQPFLAAGNVDADVAMVFAALSRPLGRRAEAIALMERVLETDAPSLDTQNRIALHFALGRLYDDAADYPRAFSHYRQANALVAQPFDSDAHTRHVDALIATFSRDFMARAPRATVKSQRPVLIVGMPRSGTSLVEQILASHPMVFGAGELEALHTIARDLPAFMDSRQNYPACLDTLTQDQCDTLARRYLDHICELAPADAVRVTDKMPSNFLHLGLIALLLPGARIIHCTRDPLDTCLSCYFQRFAAAAVPYAFDLAHTGAFYNQYLRLMAHWRKVLDVNIMEVAYEDLVADQETVSRAMVEFCGLEWDERCLRYHETQRVVATSSYDQVRQPLYDRSVGRWRHYAPYLDDLRNALGDPPGSAGIDGPAA